MALNVSLKKNYIEFSDTKGQEETFFMREIFKWKNNINKFYFCLFGKWDGKRWGFSLKVLKRFLLVTWGKCSGMKFDIEMALSIHE